MREEEGEESDVELVEKTETKVVLLENTERIQGEMETIEGKSYFFKNGAYYEYSDSSLESITSETQESNSNEITSPMPGTVTKIYVKEGDVVEKDNILLKIEAMKMENKIYSWGKLKIKKVLCSEKTFIDIGEVLIETEPAEG